MVRTPSAPPWEDVSFLLPHFFCWISIAISSFTSHDSSPCTRALNVPCLRTQHAAFGAGQGARAAHVLRCFAPRTHLSGVFAVCLQTGQVRVRSV